MVIPHYNQHAILKAHIVNPKKFVLSKFCDFCMRIRTEKTVRKTSHHGRSPQPHPVATSSGNLLGDVGNYEGIPAHRDFMRETQDASAPKIPEDEHRCSGHGDEGFFRAKDPST